MILTADKYLAAITACIRFIAIHAQSTHSHMHVHRPACPKLGQAAVAENGQGGQGFRPASFSKINHTCGISIPHLNYFNHTRRDFRVGFAAFFKEKNNLFIKKSLVEG